MRPAVIPTFRQDGSVMNLADPRVEDIDFAAMATGLSKIARFSGVHPGIAYSVAQHSVMGADALFRETGDHLLAGYFMLHDGHEYLCGDITRPMVDLVCHHHAAVLRKRHPKTAIVSNLVKEAIEAAKRSIDVVIYRAAGIPDITLMPLHAAQIKEMDDRMLRAEGIALFGEQAKIHLPAAALPPPKLIGAIQPWGAMRAEQAFVDRLEKFLGLVVARPT